MWRRSAPSAAPRRNSSRRPLAVITADRRSSGGRLTRARQASPLRVSDLPEPPKNLGRPADMSAGEEVRCQVFGSGVRLPFRPVGRLGGLAVQPLVDPGRLIGGQPAPPGQPGLEARQRVGADGLLLSSRTPGLRLVVL